MALLFRIAGTAGAVVTCPLEVVKTRFQSSYSNYCTNIVRNSSNSSHHSNIAANLLTANSTHVNTILLKNSVSKSSNRFKFGIWFQIK